MYWLEEEWKKYSINPAVSKRGGMTQKKNVGSALLKRTRKTNKNQHCLDEKKSLHCRPANKDSAAQALILHKALITPAYKVSCHGPWHPSKAGIHTAGQGRGTNFQTSWVTSFPPHQSQPHDWKNANQQSSSLVVVWFFFNTELQLLINKLQVGCEWTGTVAVRAVW